MATLLAAGAASCAGYIIGNLAVKKPARPPRHLHHYPPQARHLHHLPPRRSPAPTLPQTTFLQAGVVPAPKRVMPGQCHLCESWFQHGDVVAKLYCGHVVHRQCMETFARQPVFEGFRCTCVVCRGGSWITRFAVTEINPPSAPSVAPFTPVTQPPVHVSTQPVAPYTPPPVPTPVQPPVAAPPAPVATPAAPTLTRRVPTPPAPTPVVQQISVLTDVSSTSTSHARSSVEDASDAHVPVPAAPIPAATSQRHTFVSLQPSTHRPSCTLCACKLCLQNHDGNCARCGRCLCYECMYADCECCCSCTPELPDASHASWNDFVPLY